jgi:hypothetical protein
MRPDRRAALNSGMDEILADYNEAAFLRSALLQLPYSLWLPTAIDRCRVKHKKQSTLTLRGPENEQDDSVNGV